MGFGNQLFQLAQGIIANERQRKAQEEQAKRFDFQKKQATESLALQKKSIEAKEAFNEIQLQFQQLKLKEAGDDEMQDLRRQKLQSEIDLNKANAAAAGRKGTAASKALPPKDIFAIRAGIDKNARQLRVQKTINSALEDGAVTPIPGAEISASVINNGMIAARVRSKEGLETAIESKQREIDIALQATVGLGDIEDPTVTKLRNDMSVMQSAMDQLLRVESAVVSRSEFVVSAGQQSGISANDAANIYDTVQRPGALREQIFGTGAISSVVYNQAVIDAIGGRTDTMAALIRQTPTNLLNDDGKLRDGEASVTLNEWLAAEGIADADVRNEILREFIPNK
jgi:hypothetical protein